MLRCAISEKISRTRFPDVGHSFGLIVIENLNIKGLAAGMLAKSVNDAGMVRL